MAKTYKNPPLLETVSEFRFVLDNEYSKEQTEAFYEKIKINFPLNKKGKMHKFELKIEAENTLEENKKSFNQDFYEFEQYFSEDEKNSVQLHSGKVSIHRIKPYTSWGEFFPLIQNVYKSYIDIFSPKQVMRIGIRYVNEIILPIEDGFLFTDYFTVKASLPSLEENNQISIFLGSIFAQESGRDAIKVQFTEKQSLEETINKAFILDLDYFLVKPEISFDDIDDWLDKAHTNLEKVFEGMVTEKTKQIFDK